MPGFLTHDSLLELFGELNSKLAAKGVRGQVYIVGGAAMALGFRRERATRDVDARIVAEEEAVLDAASEIADGHDLPPNWLNQHARLFMPTGEDTRARVVFEAPNLIVTGASAEYLLVMKLYAARAADVEDVRVLTASLGIETTEQGADLYGRVFPGETLHPAGLRLLRTALAAAPEP